MRRIGIFIVLPVLLCALETVNLIKDHSFEKDSDVWAMRAGSQWADAGEDSAFVNRHDSINPFDGLFSASGDTRNSPAWAGSGGFDSAMIVYSSFVDKKVGDLDSLIWNQRVIGKDNLYTLTILSVAGFILNADSLDCLGFGYRFTNPSFTWGPYPGWVYVGYDMPEDTLWAEHARDLRTDLVENFGFSLETTVDSLVLISWGYWYTEEKWYSQKVYWDDIRLMGYADYDVGIKEILSGDSLEKDTPYTPIARIKNFGREDAPDFSVIVEIFEGETRVYYDSLPWSLTSDTEDTVTFAVFTPSSAANHTLTIRTIMEPDESDEDDEMTKTLFGSGIAEPVTQPSSLQLDIAALSSIRYSIPSSEQGTITLYDPSGRRIESLTVRGSGQVNLKPGLVSGVYFVRLETGKMTLTRKALIVK